MNGSYCLSRELLGDDLLVDLADRRRWQRRHLGPGVGGDATPTEVVVQLRQRHRDRVAASTPRSRCRLRGKIDRRAAARDLAVTAAGFVTPDHRVPSTPLESALAAIVCKVLGVESVGIDDDFFALGGEVIEIEAGNVVAAIAETEAAQ